MRQMFSSATVMWTEREIVERETLTQRLFQAVSESWTSLNPAVRFCRVETPILTPVESLAGHVGQGFPMLETKRGLMRPETTAGCIAAFHDMFPNEQQRRKRMPFCVWQAGKSFREEANPDTMRASKLRLVEFWQLEFELFAAADSKADYLGAAAAACSKMLGATTVSAEELPHYSRRTIDLMRGELEIAGCSERTDWPDGIIHELSFGLDRIVATTWSE